MTGALVKQVASRGPFRFYRIGTQCIDCLTLIRAAPYSILPSGAVSSAVEHRSYTPRATGSNPVPPTTKVNSLPMRPNSWFLTKLLLVFVSFVQELFNSTAGRLSGRQLELKSRLTHPSLDPTPQTAFLQLASVCAYTRSRCSGVTCLAGSEQGNT